MGKRRERNPAVIFLKKEIRTLDRTAKMEKDLRRHGTEIPGGYSLTASQLAKFFQSVRKKRRR